MQAGKAGARLTSRLPARQLELTVQRTTAPRLIRRPRQALSTSTRMGTQERCGAFYRRGRASPGQDGDGWRADRSQDRVSFAQCHHAQTNALRALPCRCPVAPVASPSPGLAQSPPPAIGEVGPPPEGSISPLSAPVSSPAATALCILDGAISSSVSKAECESRAEGATHARGRG